MKIADLKQPYRRMAEYLAERNTDEAFTNKDVLIDAFYWNSTKYVFWIDIYCGGHPPITEEIKKHFPPDFDFSGEEEAVNTNPFSVDGLSLNQIAVRMFKKNFMDLELWEQGLVNETVEQNDIAKNSIIELPNNPIIQKTIYTQLAKEGKFDQLPDTCEFSEAVELEVWNSSQLRTVRQITGKYKDMYVDDDFDFWDNAKLPTKKIDFSEFKAGDVVEVELSNEEKRIGWFDYADRNQVVIKTLQRKGNQVCNGGSCSGSKMFNLEKIKSITKIK